jgi:pimeloyl-ACP methyl ester carboxylesterase
MKRLAGAAFVCCLLLLGRPLAAQTAGHLNFAWKTLGGEQFWSDELVFGKWRIQRSEITSHYRLLDPFDVRRAWGSADECRTALADVKRIDQLPPLDGKAVITLHGFGRSRDHMAALGSYLEQQGGYTWINVSYASTRRTLDDHAQSLARVIDGLEGIDEIHFVTHSLGSLVVRRYLGESSQPNPRWQPDTRIKRMVMLGPPNQGAQLAHVVAELLNDNDLARLIAGPSAWQLARQWEETRTLLATPAFEFGVIAGGCGTPSGHNPLLKGDDDLVVTVEETRLPGATDFRIVPARHGHLVSDPLVQQYALSFLTSGCFTSADERQPILAEMVKAVSSQP